GAISVPSKYRLKTAEEYGAESGTAVPVLRKYLRYTRLEDVIMRCPLPQRARMSTEQKGLESNRRRCFLDFLRGLFRLNPFERWTAKQALAHPFIQNVLFSAPYCPPADVKVNLRKLNFTLMTARKPPFSQPAPLTSPLTSVRTALGKEEVQEVPRMKRGSPVHVKPAPSDMDLPTPPVVISAAPEGKPQPETAVSLASDATTENFSSSGESGGAVYGTPPTRGAIQAQTTGKIGSRARDGLQSQSYQAQNAQRYMQQVQQHQQHQQQQQQQQVCNKPPPIL
ncbi:hypothetical protein B484DRAFT_271653, partial [Ochromonadaceae sp. CCMP2298]